MQLVEWVCGHERDCMMIHAGFTPTLGLMSPNMELIGCA
jgi:hypothetical protein